jgi:tetratricopeptide (TPR) repeat protein
LELIKISLPKSLYAEVLSLLSIILSYCCEYKEARKYGLKALEIYEAMKNLRGEISIYERLGWISFRSGLFKEAILFQRSGLELAEKSQNRLDLGWALNGLGGSYIEFGDVRLSEKLLKRVLLIWEEVGHKAGKFCVLLHLGIVFTNSGLIDSAIQCYEDAEKAYPIFDEESWRLGRLGQAYTLKGEFKKALKMLDESRQNNYTKNTYSTFEAEAEWFAGDCYLLQKDWNQAERHYLRAVEISQKINCYYMEARALIGLLRIQFFQHSSLTKILKFVKTVGDIAKEHEYHSILAEVYLYETLAQAINILQSLSNEGTVSENQIYQLSQQFLLALQESLLYNSYVVDKTLRKIIVFSRELNVELTNKICQELISLWQSIEFLGKPIVEVESELRKRDGLPHTQIPVLDQLTEHTKITLNLSDYV